MFRCADTYERGQASDGERKAYFDALHHELETGGLEALLYELQHWKLGDWHPREIYETAALQQQKAASLDTMDAWFVELLEDGQLPGRQTEDKSFVATEALEEDIKRRFPRPSYPLNAKRVGDYLNARGCDGAKVYKPVECRARRFPALSKLRDDENGRDSLI